MPGLPRVQRYSTGLTSWADNHPDRLPSQQVLADPRALRKNGLVGVLLRNFLSNGSLRPIACKNLHDRRDVAATSGLYARGMLKNATFRHFGTSDASWHVRCIRREFVGFMAEDRQNVGHSLVDE